jgi:ubiquinone/menaquinone biosynthesis C-methylase UbiE
MEQTLPDGTIEFYSKLRTFLKETDTVLDVGSGRGEWFFNDTNPSRRALRNITDSVGTLIGIDVDAAVLSNPVNTTNLLIREGRFPVEDQSVDVVIADWVFEHIKDTEVFVSEINRVLRSGGVLAARTPHKFNYPSIAARMISNRLHPKITKIAQVNRQEIDVFPTKFRLNTIWKIRKVFRNFQSESYIHVSSPSYYFGKQKIYRMLDALHTKSPTFFVGTIHVFLVKD